MFESRHRVLHGIPIGLMVLAILLPAASTQAGALEEEARRQLTFCYSEIEGGNFERAKASAESALRLYPPLYDAMVCKAVAYEGLEKLELAKAILLAYMEMYSGTEPSEHAVALQERLEEREAGGGETDTAEAPAEEEKSAKKGPKKGPKKDEKKTAKKGPKKDEKKTAKKGPKKDEKKTAEAAPKKDEKKTAEAAPKKDEEAEEDDAVADASGAKTDGKDDTAQAEDDESDAEVEGEEEAAKAAAEDSKKKEVAASAKAADPDQQKTVGMAVGIGLMGGGVGLLVPGVALLAESIAATDNLSSQKEKAALLGYNVDSIDQQIAAESGTTGGGAALLGVGAAALTAGVVLTIAFGTK